MKASIITIGDEILIGQITDTNSGYIASALDKIGIQTHEMLSISDDKNHILKTFANLQNTVDLVIITGGLGPTKDDITKHTIAEYFNDILVRNTEVENHIVALFRNTLKLQASQINKDQALVPSQCQVLFNAVGTAPGMWIKKGKTVFVSLPGVPYEMKYIVNNQLIPKLIREFDRPFIVHKTLLTYGHGESVIAERIADFENNLPHFVKLAYLPSPGRVRLRLTARGLDVDVLNNAIKDLVNQLEDIIGDIIVGYADDETIEVVIGQQLTEKKMSLAVAESCTGGKIAQRITAISGSSKYFKGGIVCYATQTKIDVLQISKSLIEKHSVVSAAVALEMALAVQKLMKSDYAIATTGEAGPNQGDSNAPVGTVFVAVVTPTETIVEEFNFGQPREKVIDRAVNKAFEILQKEILKKGK